MYTARSRAPSRAPYRETHRCYQRAVYVRYTIPLSSPPPRMYILSSTHSRTLTHIHWRGLSHIAMPRACHTRAHCRHEARSGYKQPAAVSKNRRRRRAGVSPHSLALQKPRYWRARATRASPPRRRRRLLRRVRHCKLAYADLINNARAVRPGVWVVVVCAALCASTCICAPVGTRIVEIYMYARGARVGDIGAELK